MNIATSNTKWQVVIPKAVRESLKLEPKTNFNVVAKDGIIYFEPITSGALGTNSDSNQAFLELLKKTQGMWGPATKAEQAWEKKRRALELRAAKRRRNAW